MRFAIAWISIALTALALGGCSREKPKETGSLGTSSEALSTVMTRTYGFESLSDWSPYSSSPTLALSNTRTEGLKSLAVSGGGWSSFISRALSKEEPGPDVVGFDLRIPTSQPNPDWYGTIELFVDIPSRGVNNQPLGIHMLTLWTPGQWRRAEFGVPAWIKTAMNGRYSDLRFRIQLNVPTNSTGQYLFDRLELGYPPPACTPQSDNNPCTADTCDANGQQQHTPLPSGTSCADANACNGAEICNATGTCVAGTPVVCAASDQCHDAGTCNPSTGVCSNPAKPNGAACSDANACTQTDTCQSGTCSGANPVVCAASDQCHNAGTCNAATGVCSNPAKPNGSACSDGNACTQTDTCQTGACSGGNPVVCVASDACHNAGTCNTSTGVCTNPAKPDGASCADATVCNGAETCTAGTCVAGTPPIVDDGNPCTADSCDATSGVAHAPVSAGTSCADADLCDGAETCNGSGQCVAGTAVTCVASDQCHLAGTCNPSTGVCSNPARADGSSCSDGNACTQTDTCQAGSCTGDNAVVCVASDACHDIGTCNTGTGVCTNPAKPDGTSCADATVCNGSEACSSGTCVAGAPPVVDDANPCTTDACDSVAGVTHTPVAVGTSCSDGDACDGAETCDGAAQCAAGTPVVCVATDQCHLAGTCDPATGACSNPAKADGSSCSDGSGCTTSDACQAGVCVGANPVVCVASDQCHVAGVCDPQTGMCSNPVRPNGTACSDDNECTETDTCEFGTCIGSSPVVCVASDQCHDPGTCDPTTGVCSSPAKADGTPCPDATVCNGSETCSSGTCVAGTPPVIDDGNPCTADTCDPLTGTTHDPLSQVGCDDGNLCNGFDHCVSGVCVHDATIDDGNPCTVESCDPLTGETTYTPVAEGTACGDPCLGTGTCDISGFCQIATPGAEIEDDQNPCTADTCDPQTGSTAHTPQPSGTSCDFDSNECNGTDTCDGQGECIAGTPPSLDDGNPCTRDECFFSSSTDAYVIAHFPLAMGTICGDDDTDPCNGAFACDNGANCSVSRGADDGNSCTVDSCDPIGGIVNEALPDGTACSDDSACTGFDTCGGGICQPGQAVDVDSNPCTEDICGPGGTVTHNPLPFWSCDDGDLCNGIGTCDENAVCVLAPSDPVDDGNPCTTDFCDPVSGAQHTPVSEGTVCASGTACASERTCDLFGECLPGAAVDVNDGNPCTTDACDPVVGVTHEPSPLGASCDADGDACTGIDTCSGSGTCVPGSPPALDDGNPCTADACDPAAGVTHTAVPGGTSCSNGDACDGSEECDTLGACSSGTPPALDDGNPCTADACDPDTGVHYERVATGTVCGTELFCDALGACVPLPPDPASVAPPNAPGIATTVFDSTRFLYTGANPIQRGVADGTITVQRAAVLRGAVMTRDGEPLAGVGVTVKDHPEFGATLSREDGCYDLAVNGGESVTLNYETVGRLRAQRTVTVPWQDFVDVDTVAMIELDPIVTAIDFSGDGNVALGSQVTDEDGTRRAAIIFQTGTTATMVLPDGSEEPLDTMSVRVTEYTVGPNGLEAMPAQLPPTSAYTYAAELSADEAIAAGATSVQFDRPAALYVDNFLGFPVGSSIPAGFYDYAKAAWVGTDDGRCIEILDIVGEHAVLDVEGSGSAAGIEDLEELGVAEEELAELATLFVPGTTLLRTPTTHFSTIDTNLVFSLPPDAERPADNEDEDRVGLEQQADADEDKCTEPGCVINVASGTLSESVPVAGTPFSLNYSSRLTRGYQTKSGFVLKVTGSSVPASLLHVEVEATVAGVKESATLPPLPNLEYALRWNGLDAYGRRVNGKAPATIEIRYMYRYNFGVARADMPATPEGLVSWALATGAPLVLNGIPIASRAPALVPLSSTWHTNVLTGDSWGAWAWDVRGADLAGWTLDVHHTYDPTSGALVLGTGELRREAQAFGPTMYSVAGNGPDRCCTDENCPDDGSPASLTGLGAVSDILSMPDGSFLVVGSLCDKGVLRRVATDGTIRALRTTDFGVNMGRAIVGQQLASDLASAKLAPGPNETVYVADSRSVSRLSFVDEDLVTVTRVAGTRSAPETAIEGIPAVDAYMNGSPLGVAVAPDGTVFISDGHMIRAVGGDGIIHRIAGLGGPVAVQDGDGGPALEANLVADTIALGPDGSLYVGSYQRSEFSPPPRVRRISPDGIITNFAGGGTGPDGTPAKKASLYGDVNAIAMGPKGEFNMAIGGGWLFGDPRQGVGLVRFIEPAGIVRTIAGRLDVNSHFSTGDATPARDQRFSTRGLEHAPDGSLLLLATNLGQPFTVRRIAPALPGVGSTGYQIAASGGLEVYRFDHRGKHLETRDGVTGVVARTFAYDSAGALIGTTDRDGNTTTIERDASGRPLRIVGPFGQATELTLDANGYLSTILDPEGGNIDVVHDGNGLLRSFTDARGGTRLYTYDDVGRLISDSGPDTASRTFARSEGRDSSGNGVRTVTSTTGGGLSKTYRWIRDAAGTRTREVTTGDLTTFTEEPLEGSSITTMPDGTIVSTSFAPDPRYGMAGFYESGRIETTPAGLTRTTARSKTFSVGAGIVEHTTTKNGAAWLMRFNPSTREHTTTSPEGRATRRVLDASGRVARIELDGILPLELSYDARGRLEQTSWGDRVASLTYTASSESTGYLDRIVAPDATTTSYTRDGLGRALTETTGGETASFTWDPNGNLTTVLPPGRPAHQMDYTSAGLLMSYTPPAAGLPVVTTLYGYDVDRRLTTETRPTGQLLSQTFDALGRLDTLLFPGGLVDPGYQEANTNGAGRVKDVLGPYGVSLHFAYDGPLRTSMSWAGDVVGGLTRSYRDDFLAATERVSDASGLSLTTHFGYDLDQLLTCASPTTCSPPGNDALLLTRHPQNSLISNITLGSTSEAWSYNSFGELSRQTASFGASSVVDIVYDEPDFGRDTLGRLVRKTETILGTTKVYEYRYDALRRLDQVMVDGGLAEEFTYDSNGNRLTGFKLGQGTMTATYDDQDRLLTYGSWVYSYTANGDLEMKTNAETSEAWLYQYDALGNLLSVGLPNGDLVEYLVDGAGRRVGKKKNGVLLKQWIYRDVLKPVAELDGAGNLVAQYVFGSKKNVPDYVLRGDAMYRVVSDQLGSPIYVVNVANSSDVPYRAEYSTFGEVTGTGLDWMPFGFAGGTYDSETGLVRFGQRDLDTSVGRWTAKEPLRFAGARNFYAYASGDPINFADVDGRVVAAAPLVVGGAIIVGGVALWAILAGNQAALDDLIHRIEDAFEDEDDKDIIYDDELTTRCAEAAEGAYKECLNRCLGVETQDCQRAREIAYEDCIVTGILDPVVYGY